MRVMLYGNLDLEIMVCAINRVCLDAKDYEFESVEQHLSASVVN